MQKNTICVWYDKDAEAAARFYAKTFPDSAVGAIHRAHGDYPSWSPAGSKIAFKGSQGTEALISKPDGSDQHTIFRTRLTGGQVLIAAPVWSSDSGALMLQITAGPKGDSRRAYVVSPNGRETARIDLDHSQIVALR